MEPDRLETILRQAVMDGPREPLSPECLTTNAILALLDDPGGARPQDLRHLADCGHCQRAVALMREHRGVVEAPWEEGTLRFPSTSRWRPAVMAIAAMLVLAVGMGLWWRSNGPAPSPVLADALLGSITGGFESGVRGDDRPASDYKVVVRLKAPAYLMWLYLDYNRKLQLPQNAPQEAQRWEAGFWDYGVKVDSDPPGPQWIAAIVSRQSFNTLALREELQAAIDALPNGATFDDVVAVLENILEEHKELGFRDHRFNIGTTGEP